MLYIDVQTAGQNTGLFHSSMPRLIQCQNGQENSADGAGLEETCDRQGGARGIARRRHASEWTYYPHPNGPTSLPGPDRTVDRKGSGQSRHYRPASDDPRGLV